MAPARAQRSLAGQELLMPRLADAMEEGTILKWLVVVGDELTPGTPLAEIETDKAGTTYEAEVHGVVTELIAAEGDTVAVGAPIARIAAGDSASSDSVAPPGPPASGGARGAVEIVEPSRARRSLARRAAESKATAPDYFVELDIDMSACAALRERLRRLTEPSPSFGDMVVKAAASALREFPRLNGAYRDGRFESYSRVNVAIAVATPEGVALPTLHDADRQSLGEIARRTSALVERARAGGITPPELSGATFTISNLGPHGVRRASAVLAPPQAAILSVGEIARRPIVDEHGRIVARELMTATLVCDQRIVLAAEAAAFLTRLRELLETTAGLAL